MGSKLLLQDQLIPDLISLFWRTLYIFDVFRMDLLTVQIFW